MRRLAAHKLSLEHEMQGFSRGRDFQDPSDPMPNTVFDHEHVTKMPSEYNSTASSYDNDSDNMFYETTAASHLLSLSSDEDSDSFSLLTL